MEPLLEIGGAVALVAGAAGVLHFARGEAHRAGRGD